MNCFRYNKLTEADFQDEVSFYNYVDFPITSLEDFDFEYEIWKLGYSLTRLFFLWVFTSWIMIPMTYLRTTIILQQIVNFSCPIPALKLAGLSDIDINIISIPSFVLSHQSCWFYDYDYSTLSEMLVENITHYALTHPRPLLRDCLSELNETIPEHSQILLELDLRCQWYDSGGILIFTAYVIGNILGGSIGGRLCDVYGRLRMIRIMIPFHICGALLGVVYPSYFLFCFSRFLISFTSAIIFIAGFCIFFEYANTVTRGFIVFMYPLIQSCSYSLLYYMLNKTTSWRRREYLMLATNIGLVLSAIVLPESAQWLKARSQNKKAWKTMLSYKFKRCCCKRLYQAPAGVTNKPKQKEKICTIFRNVYYQEFFMYIILFSLVLSPLLTSDYDALIVKFQKIDLGNYMFYSINYVLVACLAPFPLAYFAKRKTVLIVYLVMALLVSMACFGTQYGSIIEYIVVSSAHVLIRACFCIVCLMAAEIFPTTSRGFILGVIYTIQFLLFWVGNLFFVDLMYAFIGEMVLYIPHIVACILCLLFLRFLPETRN